MKRVKRVSEESEESEESGKSQGRVREESKLKQTEIDKQTNRQTD